MYTYNKYNLGSNKMIKKEKEKLEALDLRRQGLSYREILERVTVSKSSLSLWLQSVGLSKTQKQRLTEKKLASARRGALKKKEDRIFRTGIIMEEAKKEVGKLTERERWLIGVALYWAEGSKEKEWSPGSSAQLINSDPRMIQFFLKWLIFRCKIPKNMLQFEIYIHENHKYRLGEVRNYWSLKTGFSEDNFQTVYFKKNKIHTKRKNTGNKYFGMLKIKIKKSSGLVRKIAGWVDGINAS